MRIRSALVLSAPALLLAAAPAFAHDGALLAASDQPAPQAPTFKLEKVSDHVSCLFGKGGNVGILATDDGVVVVDDQYPDVAQGIVEQIKAISDKPIRYLINTHYHGDHTGGNPVFQALTTLVAHDSVRPRLLEYPVTIRETFPDKMQALHWEIRGLTAERDAYRDALMSDLNLMKYLYDLSENFDPARAAAPSVTFDKSLTLWLGDQPIEIFHIGPGHTDGDAVVWFPKEKVVHMGDLLVTGTVPLIDTLAGGSARGYLKNMDAVLARIPPDTKVIAGHGPTTDVAGLRHARDFMKDLEREVTKAIQAGKSRADAARSIKLDTYTDIKPGFRTIANVALAYYDEIRAKK
jgi:glyoxylase-like metal-dependent hydrolase (beta-lactamase superfamily II)